MHELQELYSGELRLQIDERLRNFERLWEEAGDDILFLEMVFCVCTPQSKADKVFEAVQDLMDHELIFDGEAPEIAAVLKRNGVRFHNAKATRIVENRAFHQDLKCKLANLLLKGDTVARDWLVKSIKGFGYKESGHFLRNIGFGKNIAILDRHILRGLEKYNVIEEIPQTLSKKVYLEIEEKMRAFADSLDISMGVVDLLFWYQAKGGIFK